MGQNSAMLLELDQALRSLEGAESSQSTSLEKAQMDLEQSLDDLEGYISSGKTYKKSTPRKPNRIDLSLKKHRENEENSLNPNLDIEILDFEDTDIPYIDFR